MKQPSVELKLPIIPNMELIATIGCILLIVSMSAMSVYIIINTIKSERNRRFHLIFTHKIQLKWERIS